MSGTNNSARGRGVSFEDTINTNRSRNVPKRSDRAKVTSAGDYIKLDLSKKLSKNKHLPGQYEGKNIQILSLESNSLTKFETNEHGFEAAMHRAVFSFKLGLSKLLELDLSQNKLTNFLSAEDLRSLPSLSKLNMNTNQIAALPSDALVVLAQHGRIVDLNLGSNHLERLPAEIGELVSLKQLNLKNNKLTELPPEIVNLEGLYNQPSALNIAGNTSLIAPNYAIALLGGLEWVRYYFKINAMGEDAPTTDRYLLHLFEKQVNHSNKKSGGSSSTGKNPLRRSLQLKLLVVGRDDAGKTSVIAKLVKAQNQHHAHCTDGVGSGTPSSASHTSRTFSADDPPAHQPAPALRGVSGSGPGAKEPARVPFELKLPGSVSKPGRVNSSVSMGTPATATHTVLSPISSSGSRPSTPSTAHSHSHSYSYGAFTPHRDDVSQQPLPVDTNSSHGKLDCLITPWFPKKAVLDKFVLPRTKDDQKLDKVAKSLFTVEPDDIKFTIWNFVGKWMFHTVYEMFFSASALHMLVFDLSLTATEHDCDKYVQYWVDLIQARAPGSSIIVVATHADLLAPSEEKGRLHMVAARLESNEALRIQDLQRDVEYCTDPDRKEVYRELLLKRPVIDKQIIALRHGSSEQMLNEILCLSVRIVQLATPTREHPSPFMTVGTPLEGFFFTVKESLSALRKSDRAFCTVEELNQYILERSDGSNRAKAALTGTKVALAHWTSVGEILWFNLDKHEGSSSRESTLGATASSERVFQPLTRAMTGDFSDSEDQLLAPSDVVFLNPNWLMGCIKTILSRDLVQDLKTTERWSLHRDEESRRAEESLKQAKAFADRGIFKWETIRTFVKRRVAAYDPKVVDVVRVILERFNILIPIRAQQAAPMVKTPSGGRAAPPARAVRHSTEPGLELTVPPTPLSAPRRSARSTTSAATNFSALPTPRLDRLFDEVSPSDQQYYLVPALVPALPTDMVPRRANTITLERVFHFNRFTPPGLVQAIYARVYTLPEGGTEGQGLPNAIDDRCWDRAFVQQHGTTHMHVELVAHLSAGALGESGGQDLRIRGTNSIVNLHCILEQLDRYTAVTQQILAEFPGLGHVRLSSTCPDCLVTQVAEGHRGEFRHSELVTLQATLLELTDLLQTTRKGHMSKEVREQLLRWHSKRHTCPKFRQHQIKSEMLIHVPRPLKKEIDRASYAEKEIDFLLDEVVRTAAVPLAEASRGVVKVMCANACHPGDLASVKAHLAQLPPGASSKAAVDIHAMAYCSGVVVPLPENHPLLANTTSAFRTNEVLVLCCEHVITGSKTVNGRMEYSGSGKPGLDLLFLVGDASHWLYVAEMVFQGSQQPRSEHSFWDLCALRIVAPISPVPQLPKLDDFEISFLLRNASSLVRPGLERAGSVMSIDTTSGGPIELQHPMMPGRPPFRALPVSTHPVAVDQVVRLLGYPGFPTMMGLSVDWGRVEQNDPQGDILIGLLSDSGTSGGPVLDREGCLIGLLSRSHDYVKFSCIQPVRDMFDILHTAYCVSQVVSPVVEEGAGFNA